MNTHIVVEQQVQHGSTQMEHINMQSGYVFVNVSGTYAIHGLMQRHAGLTSPSIHHTENPAEATFTKSPYVGNRNLSARLQSEGFSAIKVQRTISVSALNEH